MAGWPCPHRELGEDVMVSISARVETDVTIPPSQLQECRRLYHEKHAAPSFRTSFMQAPVKIDRCQRQQLTAHTTPHTNQARRCHDSKSAVRPSLEKPRNSISECSSNAVQKAKHIVRWPFASITSK